jgi:hypothetical protein
MVNSDDFLFIGRGSKGPPQVGDGGARASLGNLSCLPLIRPTSALFCPLPIELPERDQTKPTKHVVEDFKVPGRRRTADRQTDRQTNEIFAKHGIFSIFCKVLSYIINHKRRAVAKFSLHFINVDTGAQMKTRKEIPAFLDTYLDLRVQ